MSKNLEKMPLCSTDDGVGQAGLETQSPTCAGTVDPTAQFRRYHIQNMCCPVEERLIRNRLEGMHGVIRLEINLINRVLGVHYDLASDESISKALSSIGMQAEPLPLNVAVRGAAPHGAAHRNNAHKLLLSLSGVTAVTAETLAWTGHSDASTLVIALALASIVSGGLPTLRKGWIALKHLTLNIHFLMSLAVVGALAIGQWPEAAMVIFLFAVAEAIEAKSLDRARNAVHSLLQIVPDTAFVQSENGSWETMRADQVRIGALIRVRPGERIPLDGVVEAGESAVDQAPITGESIPVEKHKGDAVFAGTINDAGTLDIRVIVASDDSTLAHIVRVLEETQGRQAPTQRFIDTFARYYTPAVVLAALGVAIVPPLAFGVPAAAWLYKALVMLVIACPCALVISTPVTVVSGLTAAARRGILIKGGEFLEAGHRIRVIALDKTGTLTRGEPVVTEVAPLAGMRPADVLLLAASLNVHSAHPLARAIAAGAPAGRMLRQVRAFASLPGRGIRGDIGGKTHYLGNVRLLDDQGGGLTENNGANTRSMLARMEEEGHTRPMK